MRLLTYNYGVSELTSHNSLHICNYSIWESPVKQSYETKSIVNIDFGTAFP